MKLFVTGAAGFIGSNYVRMVLDTTDDEITVTYEKDGDKLVARSIRATRK